MPKQHLPILKICSCPCQAGPNAFRGMELRYRSSTELVIWMISLDLFMPVHPFCIHRNCYGRFERPHFFIEFLPALF